DSHLGIGPGLFLHNSTITVDSRVIRTYPPLNALYMLPGYYYDRADPYTGEMPWNESASFNLAPRARKLFDIAGIDAFTVDAGAVSERNRQMDVSYLQRI